MSGKSVNAGVKRRQQIREWKRQSERIREREWAEEEIEREEEESYLDEPRREVVTISELIRGGKDEEKCTTEVTRYMADMLVAAYHQGCMPGDRAVDLVFDKETAASKLVLSEKKVDELKVWDEMVSGKNRQDGYAVWRWMYLRERDEWVDGAVGRLRDLLENVVKNETWWRFAGF